MRKTEPDNRDMTFSNLASKMKTKIRGVAVNTFQGEYPLTNSSLYLSVVDCVCDNEVRLVAQGFPDSVPLKIIVHTSYLVYFLHLLYLLCCCPMICI